MHLPFLCCVQQLLQWNWLCHSTDFKMLQMHSSWYGMVREMIECWCGNLTNWHKGCICRNYSGQGIFFCPCSFWTYIVFVVNGIPDLGQTTTPQTASTTPYVYRLCSLTAHRMLWDCVYYLLALIRTKQKVFLFTAEMKRKIFYPPLSERK